MGGHHFFRAAAACALIVATSAPAGAVATPRGSLNLLTNLSADAECAVLAPDPPFEEARVGSSSKKVSLGGTFQVGMIDGPSSEAIKLSGTSTYAPRFDGRYLKVATLSGRHQIQFSRADAVCNARFTASTTHYLTFPVKKTARLQISWDNDTRAKLLIANVYHDEQTRTEKKALPASGKFATKVTPGTWTIYLQVDTTLSESKVPANSTKTIKAPFDLKVRVD